jgi:DNA replication protein
MQDNSLTVLMTSGFVAVPGILLREYKQLGLRDEEMMLLLHLLQFRQEGTDFPTPRELIGRMTLQEDTLETMLYRLMRHGFLDIVEVRSSGVMQEAYDLRPLYHKLAELLEPKAKPAPTSLDLLERKEQNNIFALFEQEFGRPLSPLEYEKIVRWLDEDHYKEELIREALREAVMAAKFNFKYIDRILFEWQKNNIRSMQDLNAYREQFRNRMSGGGRTGQQHASTSNRNKSKETGSSAVEHGEDKYDAFYRMFGRD